MENQNTCWCGNQSLLPFSKDYFRCPVCETLVIREFPSNEVADVKEDDEDFYGKNYWFNHVAGEFGQENIIQRSRSDHTGRNLYWLRTLLKFKLMPGTTLELGCAHGGFVQMLKWAGFDAAGLELSPWIVDYARKTFDIPVYLGPIEKQDIRPGSLDAIIMMDVLEHFRDPLSSISHCSTLLKPDGILYIQTPLYPAGMTYESMVEAQNPFLIQLKAPEHIYLFSQQSISKFFEQVGLGHFSFEPAIFGHYDMSVIASKTSLQVNSQKEIEERLLSIANGRLVLALLDLYGFHEDIKRKYDTADEDRTARTESINKLEALLKETNADRAVRLESIQKLQVLLEESEKDRAARLESIQKLQALLEESEKDRIARLDVIQNVEAQRKQLEYLLGTFQDQVNMLEMERSAQLAMIRQLEEKLDKPIWWHAARRIKHQIQKVKKGKSGTTEANRSHLYRIGIDLTPLLPGHINGGAKPLTLNLIWNLAKLYPQNQYVLLGSNVNQEELSNYFRDFKNIEFHCVHHQPSNDAAHPSDNHNSEPIAIRLKRESRNLLKRYLPVKAKNILKRMYYQVKKSPQNTGLIRQIGIDLMFYPFTGPFYYDPRIPSVSLVHDLQYLSYPQFFKPEEFAERDLAFRRASTSCERVVTVSEFVRQTVLLNEKISPNKVKVVYNTIDARPLINLSEDEQCRLLSKYEVEARNYLIYPANFWFHKNHIMLLVAFNMFIHQHPEYSTKLVLTGAPGKQSDAIISAAKKMGIGDRVVFTGFVNDNEFQVLLKSAGALIFPSLYEGFGIPVIEAMQAYIPVICSNVTSLPEVGGEAVYYFDPKKPHEIADAIFKVLSDVEFRETLKRRGIERVRVLGDSKVMAHAYYSIFQEILEQGIHDYPMKLEGLYQDHWTSGTLTIFYSKQAQPSPRRLEVTLQALPWFKKKVIVQIFGVKNEFIKELVFKPGETANLSLPLSSESGCLELKISPTFRPDLLNQGNDERNLGLVCSQCKIVSADSVYDYLESVM